MDKVMTVVLSILALPLCTQAESAWDINPLESVERVGLEITLGGSLALESSEFALFAGDHDRAQHFRESLSRSVERSLQESGIEISKESDTTILISVYGRPVDQGPGSSYVCLLEVAIDTFDETDECSYCSSPVSNSHIALLKDSSLETSLIEAAVWLLERNWLDRRDGELADHTDHCKAKTE